MNIPLYTIILKIITFFFLDTIKQVRFLVYNANFVMTYYTYFSDFNNYMNNN